MSTKPGLFTKFPAARQNLVNRQYQTLAFGKLVRIDRLSKQVFSGTIAAILNYPDGCLM
jgi:hypothetical protein